MKWDVFISHASEDKESIAKPIAKALIEKGLRVWLDEIVLKVGDSLREKIDEGLANSSYGIVILSQSFFQKNWPTAELNALFSKETTRNKVILPIWHGIDINYIKTHSPILADRLAINSSKGVQAIVDEVLSVIHGSAIEKKLKKKDELSEFQKIIIKLIKGKPDVTWTFKVVENLITAKKVSSEQLSTLSYELSYLVDNNYLNKSKNIFSLSEKGKVYCRKQFPSKTIYLQ